ncbi:hypothetical protein [Pelagicoccus sp. SDUM812005]|uniref:hypothetical protein n=1 Tax=Pelagicoccus sp. SDUM812005 TaxID=3041257 RepID=UPI002810693E|nr:hypothetical protein [Pelagicoccus sp. SDUM812005]MDQ8180677.1 hypothetical protein [Pelagicoccus sp. SDUM812005]
MKSKSPSAASKKSTRKTPPVALSFSQRPQCRSTQTKAPRYAASLAALPLLAAALLAFSSCATAPASSQVEVTAPSAITPAIPPAGEPHTRSITVQTPTPGWTLVPMMLYRSGENRYLCIHSLSAPQGMVAQMLSTASTQLTFRHDGSAEPSIRHYVLGKTWNWNGNPELTFIDSLDQIKDALADARSVPFTTP